MESLVAFYEASAAVEIDDYRDYPRALQALQEASRVSSRIQARGRWDNNIYIGARIFSRLDHRAVFMPQSQAITADSHFMLLCVLRLATVRTQESRKCGNYDA